MTKLVEIDFRFLFLAAMLIFLPGVEALKNIFAFLFVLSWIYIGRKDNDWGGKWLVIDAIFLFWIIADLAVSLNALFTHQLPASGFRDVLRYVLIGWVISRIHLPNEKFSLIAFIGVIATVVTLLYSYLSTGGVLKELHSVGHINHTAIFLLIAFSISLALLLFDFNNLKKYQMFILFISTLFLFYSIIDSGSRAAFGLIIFILLINFIYLILKVKKLSLIIGVIIGVIFCIMFFLQNPPDAILKTLSQENSFFFFDQTRSEINKFSFAAFKVNPLLGIGFGNYGYIDIEEVLKIISDNKEIMSQRISIHSSHAHSLYFTYLVSGGIVMFLTLAFFWIYILWAIFKLIKVGGNDWIIMASIGVLLINLAIGLVNTTFHHEHAIFSMFILGLLISKYRQIT
jgi:O-antigen ligase